MSDRASGRAAWIGGGVLLVALAGLALWALSGPAPGATPTPTANGTTEPGVRVLRDGAPRPDGGLEALAGDPRAGVGERRDDPGQAETFEGRTDGAVPLDEDTTPPYAPPEDVDRLTPEELDRRRLQQVGTIEQRIEALDQQIAAAPADSSLRGVLESRREHLEQRRAELLSTVIDERGQGPR